MSLSGLVTCAQSTVSGNIYALPDSTALTGVAVALVQNNVVQFGTRTNDKGFFQFDQVVAGNYQLISVFIGYKVDTLKMNIQNADISGLRLVMEEATEGFQTVLVEQLLPLIQIKGDTIQFNADAYKVNQDATAEDLLKKMPGITTEGSTIKINGEQIKRVLVDGKPFFSDDPAATLRNLPANMLDNMQIYDKQSDQAEFAGIKDGNAEKTINLRTKSDKKNGTFGNVYAGYGTNDRYNTGFAFNYFKQDRRITLLGMANNINQQNFSMQDFSGLMANSGQDGGGRGGVQYYSAPQNGITSTKGMGMNYNDVWGKKTTISASYFLTKTNNNNTSDFVRNYYTQDQLRYNQNTESNSLNLSHNGSLRLEIAPDSMNKIILNTRFNPQKSSSQTLLDGLTLLPLFGESTTQTNNTNSSIGSGFNINSDLQYQHRFKKRRRTVSLNVNAQWNERSGSGAYLSNSIYYLQGDSLVAIDQQYTNDSRSINIGPTLSYTEPLGKRSLLQWNARTSLQQNTAEKLTSDVNAGQLIQNILLSNQYGYTYLKNATGLYYKWSTDSIDFSIGSDIEQSKLNSDQTYPVENSIDRTFINVLPRINYSRKFSSKARLVMNLNTNTRAPSVNQMQNVLDVSNPLMVKLGNADLKQSRDNSIDMRYNKRQNAGDSHYSFMISGTQTINSIANSTTVLRNDTTIQGVLIARGAQLMQYVNVNQFYSARVSGQYGFPAKKIGSNISLSAYYNFSQSPAVINNVVNFARNKALGGGMNISSNISKEIDFTLGYSGNYNLVNNSVNSAANTSYFSQTISLRANVLLFKRIVINTDLTNNSYIGLSQARNQNYLLWSAYVGYKFGTSKEFELKASCFDILNENTNISRTVRDTYTEDTTTSNLRRYVMFTLTYTFKKFKGEDEMSDQDKKQK